MNEFKTYHPAVNFLWFIFVLGFSCVLMHPVFLAISLISTFTYSAMLKGMKAMKKGLAVMLPMLLFLAVLNPAFNHEGVTVLTYLPSGNPLTLESVWYGIAAAGMMGSILCLFSAYQELMTSDKFMCLFGKILPALSLILSMTLRFIPHFTAHLKAVSDARKCIGKDASGGNLIRRAKNGIDILSVTVTWALENAVETADSMKARGYGLPGRTAFSVFILDRRDTFALVTLLTLGAGILFGILTGKTEFTYFPSIRAAEPSLAGLMCLLAYTALCAYPIVIELKEAIKWRALKSKM